MSPENAGLRQYPARTNMRRPHSLKSAHWVMWSSPILLLVLVFTLTASSSSTPLRHSSASSTIHEREHADDEYRRRDDHLDEPPRRSRTVKASSVKIVSPAMTEPPPAAASVSKSASSSSATASNVEPVANAPDVSASNGVLSGQLSPSFAVADLPLAGPGTWDVASSAPVTVTLTCSGATIPVESQFEIAANEQCQVSITSTTPKTSLTWQLTPAP